MKQNRNLSVESSDECVRIVRRSIRIILGKAGGSHENIYEKLSNTPTEADGTSMKNALRQEMAENQNKQEKNQKKQKSDGKGKSDKSKNGKSKDGEKSDSDGNGESDGKDKNEQQSQSKGEGQEGEQSESQSQEPGGGEGQEGEQSESQSQEPGGGEGKERGNNKLTDGEKEQQREPTTPRQEKLKKALTQAIQKGVQEASETARQVSDAAKMLGISDEDMNKHAQDFAQRLDTLKYISLSKKELAKFVKETIKKASPTLFGKMLTFRENLLDAPDFSDILTPELMMNKLTMMDTKVLTQIRTCKIDIYVDKSGSMHAQDIRIYTDGGKKQTMITRMALASLLAYKLYQMGVVRKIYTFDSQLNAEVTNPGTLLILKATAGQISTLASRTLSQEKLLRLLSRTENARLATIEALIINSVIRCSSSLRTENRKYVITKKPQIIT